VSAAEAALPGAALIELSDVHKTWAAGAALVHALRGVDLRVARGELVAIVGPSGSGKTTLLEILGCLSQPSRGSYRLDGREVAALDSDELARVRAERIGFVFQGYNLLPRLSAAENVELPLVYRRVPPRERRRRAHEALGRVGLAQRATHRPSELSGGECQRVALARALVGEPALVLADEPTGNLDTATGEGILAMFGALHGEGHTLVVVTHDPRVAGLAPRRVEIHDGRIAADHRAREAP
jgi:putative ABC transport system ATP-binding protein